MNAREELEQLGFEVPDSIEPIVAYRSWVQAIGNKNTLVSHCGFPWKPGTPMKAECMHYRHLFREQHNAPMEDCTCGIYAAKKEQAGLIVPRSHIYGEVYMWGRVLEGPRGYRAEYAYPKQFFIRHKDTKKTVEDMGFGVPVIVVGGSHTGFPFPRSRIRQQVESLKYGLLPFSGVPALALATWDTLTLDMARALNEVLVGVLYLVGGVASATPFITRRIIRRMNNV